MIKYNLMQEIQNIKLTKMETLWLKSRDGMHRQEPHPRVPLAQLLSSLWGTCIRSSPRHSVTTTGWDFLAGCFQLCPRDLWISFPTLCPSPQWHGRVFVPPTQGRLQLSIPLSPLSQYSYLSARLMIASPLLSCHWTPTVQGLGLSHCLYFSRYCYYWLARRNFLLLITYRGWDIA